jgi:type II secretory pathway pseudopilin PulG
VLFGLGVPEWLAIIGLLGGLILTFYVMARASVAYEAKRKREAGSAGSQNEREAGSAGSQNEREAGSAGSQNGKAEENQSAEEESGT